MNELQYSPEQIADMCNRFDLLDYVSQFYELQEHGGEYWTSCPLHEDHTPSLSFNPEKNQYHCFSCLKGGDPIQYLRDYEGLSFTDAVNKIAKVTGTDLVPGLKSTAMEYYRTVRNISIPKMKAAPDRVILDWQKDYFQRFRKDYPKLWLDEGITKESMDKYDIMYDDVRHRIVYPVCDADGNLIGIKGRTDMASYKDMKIAKYMNYTKVGCVDYFQGLNQNMISIDEHNEIIIFEGIKSVMKADQFGYDWCVSSETSHLNDEQIELLIKMRIRNVVIAFDSDVDDRKFYASARKMKNFVNLYRIKDYKHRLSDKMSPVDAGKEIWEQLYAERRRIK